jgi:hypothetical protein
MANLSLAADKFHSGVHIWDVDLTLFTIQRKLILTIEILFGLATGLVKISILLFFRRLGSRGVSKTFRIITWVAISFIAASTIAFFISPLVGCRPISAYWEQSDIVKIAQGVEFNCDNEGAAFTVAGVISTVQDAITALLPNFIYWKAKIPFRQKAALMGIFAIAYVVAAFGALRTWSTYVLFYETYDVSWQLWEIWNWTLLEVHIGVICANVPALKVFVKRYLKIKTVVSNEQGQPKSSQAKSSQAGSSQTGSTAPSGKSRGKMAAWKDPYAHLGYFSQKTQLSTHDELDQVPITEELEEEMLTPQHTSEDATWTTRHHADGDVELGMLQLPSRPAETHRGSCGMASLYFYDDHIEAESISEGLRYMRVQL